MSLYLGNTLISGKSSNKEYIANNLLDFKWADHLLNDIQWLRADTFSWQDGNVYSAAYTHLVNDIAGVSPSTETIAGHTITYYEAADGHKIVLANQASVVANIYGATGAAWYFILDTTNERFKLPRVNPDRERLLQTIGVRGNGIAIGFTDNDSNAALQSNANGTLVSNQTLYGSNTGTAYTNLTSITSNKALGIVKDVSKSGLITDLSSTTSVFAGKKHLYFYVGEYTREAYVQTAGLNSELFDGKMDSDTIHIEETWHNANGDWYNVYSNGFCEQGGQDEITNTVSATAKTINLHKEYKDTKYTVIYQPTTSSTGSINFLYANIKEKTTSSFTITYTLSACWLAKGYIR